MGLEERLPGGLPLPLRRRLDAVLLQNVADAGIRDRMAQVGQGPLNAIVAPAGILLGQPHDQLADLVGDGRPAGPLLSFSFRTWFSVRR